MFNKEKFNEALSMYKEQFVSFEWEKENYKWIAIKCFQDNWNIEADNFSEMLGASLAKTYNLLASVNNYPKQTIVAMAEKDPDKIRNVLVKRTLEILSVLKKYLQGGQLPCCWVSRFCGSKIGPHFIFASQKSSSFEKNAEFPRIFSFFAFSSVEDI